MSLCSGQRSVIVNVFPTVFNERSSSRLPQWTRAAIYLVSTGACVWDTARTSMSVTALTPGTMERTAPSVSPFIPGSPALISSRIIAFFFRNLKYSAISLFIRWKLLLWSSQEIEQQRSRLADLGLLFGAQIFGGKMGRKARKRPARSLSWTTSGSQLHVNHPRSLWSIIRCNLFNWKLCSYITLQLSIVLTALSNRQEGKTIQRRAMSNVKWGNWTYEKGRIATEWGNNPSEFPFWISSNTKFVFSCVLPPQLSFGPEYVIR